MCHVHAGALCCTIFNPPLTARDECGCLPALLLWNPLVSYKSFVDIKCPDCGSKLELKHWNDGSCPSRQPRILHEFDNIILLVGCVYGVNMVISYCQMMLVF